MYINHMIIQPISSIIIKTQSLPQPQFQQILLIINQYYNTTVSYTIYIKLIKQRIQQYRHPFPQTPIDIILYRSPKQFLQLYYFYILRSELIILFFVYQKRICLHLLLFVLYKFRHLTFELEFKMHKNQRKIANTLAQLPVRLFMKVIEYLESEELEKLDIAITSASQYEEVKKIVTIRLQYTRYINVFDRSYYLDIFSNAKYLEKEGASYYQLAQKDNYSQLIMFTNKFQNMLQQATLLVPQTIQSEFRQELKTIFIDPAIAMPRLHRETVGLNINSNFQSYLISIRDEEGLDYQLLDETFEILKDNFQANQQTILREMMQAKHTSKLRDIRFQAHLISCKNIQQFLLGDSSLDLIVYIFGMLDLYLEQIQAHLSTIVDPLGLLVQLTSRYMHFHNFVLAVEDNLGYIFNMFDELYAELYPSNDIKFTFYRSAFMKWNMKMSKFHETTNQVFSSLLTDKINTKTLKAPVLYDKDQTYKQKTYDYLTESAFDVQSLMTLYLEYIVDLSVDQMNICWCGHSQQKFGEQHKNLEYSILGKENHLMNQLYEAYQKKHIMYEEIEQILRTRITQFEQIVKKSTLRVITNFYDRILLCKTTEFMNFIERDKIIERANRNSNIVFTKQMDILEFNEEMDIETADSSNENSLNEYQSQDQQYPEQKQTEIYLKG